MIEREKIIESYFDCWLNNNSLMLRKIFDLDAIYSECYGPKYNGLYSIERWFDDWNKQGQVLVWDIKQFIHQNNITVVEWYFKCKYKEKVSEFDGVSLIEFNNDNYIVNLKEFQSKIPHYYIYK